MCTSENDLYEHPIRAARCYPLSDTGGVVLDTTGHVFHTIEWDSTHSAIECITVHRRLPVVLRRPVEVTSGIIRALFDIGDQVFIKIQYNIQRTC